MANNFKPWIDDANVTDSNVQPGSTFASDSQRESGFSAGTVASSIRVNTALREATIVVSALVNLLGELGDGFDAQTTLTDMQDALSTYFGESVTGVTFNSNQSALVITFKNGQSQSVPITSVRGTKWFTGTYLAKYGTYIVFGDGGRSAEGDLFLITETYTDHDITFNKGDVYVCTGRTAPSVAIYTYLTNLNGINGAQGADGTGWLFGTDIVYDSATTYYTYTKSSASDPGKIGDLYLITEAYVSDGHQFNIGDVYSLNNNDQLVFYCSLQTSIRGAQGIQGNPGPAGEDGQRGSLWFEGSDLEDSSGAWWDERTFPSGYEPDIGDLYLVTTTYTDDSITFNKGDVYKISDIGPGGAVMDFVCNIAGSSGGTQKYLHSILLRATGKSITCSLITSSSAAITSLTELNTALVNAGYSTTQASEPYTRNCLLASGAFTVSSEFWIIMGIVGRSNSTTPVFRYIRSDGTVSATTEDTANINDTVVAL